MKTTRIFILLMSLLALTIAKAETFSAEIFVSDFDESPVGQMEVHFYNSVGIFLGKGTTNNNGKFNFDLSAGEFSLKLIRNGEVKKEAPLTIPELEGRKIYNRVRIQILYEAREAFEIENLNFETNSAEILSESFEILDKLVTFLFSESDSKFELVGHTDSDGSELSNKELSLARAESVKVYLVSKGVSPNQLATNGYGESKPIADNLTEEGRAKNRRTELKKILE